MGLYDDVVVGERRGQVKLWGNALKLYKVPNSVPLIGGLRDYDVAMREGGFLHIRNLRLAGWDDEMWGGAVFDKWGSEWVGSKQNLGEVGKAISDLVGHETGYFYDEA